MRLGMSETGTEGWVEIEVCLGLWDSTGINVRVRVRTELGLGLWEDPCDRDVWK